MTKWNFFKSKFKIEHNHIRSESDFCLAFFNATWDKNVEHYNLWTPCMSWVFAKIDENGLHFPLVRTSEETKQNTQAWYDEVMEPYYIEKQLEDELPINEGKKEKKVKV